MDRRSFLASSTLAAAALGGAVAAEPELAGAARGIGRRADVLVCGGGPAGIGAAMAAARLGARVLLVERYGRLGGMAVHGLVGPLMGRVTKPALVHRILDAIGGCAFDAARLDLQYADLVQSAGVEVLLHAWAVEPLLDAGRVAGARFVSKEGRFDVRAAAVVDATGDGDLAFAAGAAFEQGRPGDGLVQPMSIMYRIAGVADDAFVCGSEEAALKLKLPGGTWHAIVMKGREAGELAGSIGVIRTYRTSRQGERFVNATQINGVDGTKVADLTRAELEGRRQAYQVLEFLRKHAPGYADARIDVMPAVVGVRETRRFAGCARLSREDLTGGRAHPEAVVTGASFPIDIHNPDGVGQAEGVAARVKPYDIPYGCLVPGKVDGLLLAGRCISGTHEAHASYRVQCIAMATGVAAGAAAALSAKKGMRPRDLPAAEVQAALAGMGG